MDQINNNSINKTKYISFILLLLSISSIGLLITSTKLPWSCLPRYIDSDSLNLLYNYQIYPTGVELVLIIISIVLLSIYGVLILLNSFIVKRLPLYITIQIIPPLCFVFLLIQLILSYYLEQKHKVLLEYDSHTMVFNIPLAGGGNDYPNYTVYDGIVPFGIGLALTGILFILNLCFKNKLKQ